MILDLRVNLGIILPFPVNYSYLHVDLLMFSEEKYENIFFFILPLDLLLSWIIRPQIVIEIPMVLVLGSI